MSLHQARELLRENQNPGLSLEQQVKNLNEIVLLLLKELERKNGYVIG